MSLICYSAYSRRPCITFVFHFLVTKLDPSVIYLITSKYNFVIIILMKEEENKFSIKSEDFEGPFEVLLGMIEKKKLDVSKFSLAKITDDYISYLRSKTFEIKETAEFVWTAATLMVIKSKDLLPQLQLTEDEEEDMDDLEKRLKIFSIFKNISEKVGGVFGKNIIYKKKYKRVIEIKFSPDENITFLSMHQNALDVLQEAPKPEFLVNKKIEKTLSLKEIMTNLKSRVQSYVKTNFKNLIVGDTKRDVSISFLGILELFKQGELLLEQNGNFGDITVENIEAQKQDNVEV